MVADHLEEYFNDLTKRIEAAIVKQLEQIADKTIIDFNKIRKSKFEEMFNDAISGFYEDYKPKHYKRTESLYKILDITLSKDGRSMFIGFEPEKLLTGVVRSRRTCADFYRNPDGFYDQMFKKGWHGGAGSIASRKAQRYGNHPNPGTPYYRTPLPRKPRFGEEYTTDGYRGYFYWGRQAQVYKHSPYEEYVRRIREYENGEMKEVLEKCYRVHEAQIDLSQLRW